MDALGRRLRGHILEVLAQQVGRLISSRVVYSNFHSQLPWRIARSMGRCHARGSRAH